MPAIVGHVNHAQTPKGAAGKSAISAGNALLVWWVAIHYGEFCPIVSSFEFCRVELSKILFYSQFESKNRFYWLAARCLANFSWITT